MSRQLDSKPFGDTNCRPKTGSELPSGNATVGESPSAKGRPPEKKGCPPPGRCCFAETSHCRKAILPLFSDGNWTPNRLAIQIAVRKQGQIA
ncbi:MAG: hypothetical protein LBI18_11125 [Planctomycetaceae bacterium]|nr:hypothetical protein [Planctomycetaceae bacterium]